MIRKKAASLTDKESGIRWRSHEPSRLETFSDAVFAFAVTLVIVSLEVPKTFNELYETMKGTVSFAVCFVVIFLMWNQQNQFFRRYGLNDAITTFLNSMLLFMVLIYVYPLKFLFFLIFSSSSDVHSQPAIYNYQQPTLMLIYGLGFVVIYTLFFLMYLHAERCAVSLELTPRELYMTRSYKWANFILVCIGLTAIIMAYILPTDYAGTSGFIYMLIPVSHTIWYTIRGKKERRMRK